MLPIGVANKGVNMEKFGRVSKEYMVKQISERFRNYPDFFVMSFTNIGVQHMEKLRISLKKHSSAYMVMKNAMLKRAMKESVKGFDSEQINTLITGSCGVLFSKNNPAAISRLLVNFSKDHETMKIQGGFVNGEMISLDTIRHFASLPSRDILLAMVATGIKSPITGLVGLLNNLLRDLVGVMDAICKEKSERGEQPA